MGTLGEVAIAGLDCVLNLFKSVCTMYVEELVFPPALMLLVVLAQKPLKQGKYQSDNYPLGQNC